MNIIPSNIETTAEPAPDAEPWPPSTRAVAEMVNGAVWDAELPLGMGDAWIEGWARGEEAHVFTLTAFVDDKPARNFKVTIEQTETPRRP